VSLGQPPTYDALCVQVLSHSKLTAAEALPVYKSMRLALRALLAHSKSPSFGGESRATVEHYANTLTVIINTITVAVNKVVKEDKIPFAKAAKRVAVDVATSKAANHCVVAKVIEGSAAESHPLIAVARNTSRAALNLAWKCLDTPDQCAATPAPPAPAPEPGDTKEESPKSTNWGLALGITSMVLVSATLIYLDLRRSRKRRSFSPRPAVA
jgi:hypothetical protein